MTTVKKKDRPEEDASGEQTETIRIDLKEIYRVDPKNILPDISAIHYSNLAYVQVSQRDVCIDFLEMPGIKRDGKFFVTGTRIYMSHTAAKKLADVLGESLEHVYIQGDMETYHSEEERETKSD